MRNEVISLEGDNSGGFVPSVTTYIIDNPLSERLMRPAVLVIPGGGYRKRSAREAEPVALQFNAAGFSAFVLNYSVAPLASYDRPLKDASNAMRVIRENAEDFGIDKNKIAVCGFSAGAHLAATLCIYGDPADVPNAAILSYPVVTSGEFAHKGSFERLLGDDMCDGLLDRFSIEKHITPSFPPTFLWHTFEDGSVPVENSLLLMSALRKNNVKFEAHIYPSGGHGLSLARRDVSRNEDGIDLHVSSWMSLCVDWLRETFGISAFGC